MRAGDLDTLKNLCLRTGYTWRAASFEGFRLFNDFNFTHMQGDEMDCDGSGENIKFSEGNLNRDLWRYVVSKMMSNV